MARQTIPPHLYVTVIAIVTTNLARFSNNVTVVMSTIVRLGCGGEAVAVVGVKGQS
jgi:hypothetical protein